MMKIGVYLNQKQADRADGEKVLRALERGGAEAVLFSEIGEIGGVDRLIVLGGDGTLLRVAHQTAETGIPVVAVNYGRLGFLAEFDRGEEERAAALALDPACAVLSRSMLEVELNGRKTFCLNELTMLRAVSPGGDNRVVHIRVTVDGSPTGEIIADGLIVATPTGSTAYSLSAGGCILTPDCETFLLTPVCAFSMRSRPIACSDRSTLGFSLPESPLMLYADGAYLGTAGESDLLTVRKAERCARFLTENAGGFFRRLTQKIN